MANVVIQSNNSTVSINFNDVSNLALVSKSKWRFDALQSVFLLPNAAAVIVRTQGKDFPLFSNWS